MFATRPPCSLLFPSTFACGLTNRRYRERGFTLVELMVVVAITGVLASLATYSVRKYVLEARKAEASSMLVQIRAAEEAYRDETFVYLGMPDFSDWHPTQTPDGSKRDWSRTTPTRTQVFGPLGVTPDSPVFYSYTVVNGAAGAAGADLSAMVPGTATFDFGATQAQPWYIAMAKADLNGDGTFTYALTYSGTAAIHIDDTY